MIKSIIKSTKLLWSDEITRIEMKAAFKRLIVANIIAIIAIAILSQCMPRPLITYIGVICSGFVMNLYEFSIIFKNAVYNYCSRL